MYTVQHAGQCTQWRFTGYSVLQIAGCLDVAGCLLSRFRANYVHFSGDAGINISVLHIWEERGLPPPSSPAVGGRLKPGGRDRGAETTYITRDKKTLNELLALARLKTFFLLYC